MDARTQTILDALETFQGRRVTVSKAPRSALFYLDLATIHPAINCDTEDVSLSSKQGMLYCEWNYEKGTADQVGSAVVYCICIIDIKKKKNLIEFIVESSSH